MPGLIKGLTMDTATIPTAVKMPQRRVQRAALSCNSPSVFSTSQAPPIKENPAVTHTALRPENNQACQLLSKPITYMPSINPWDEAAISEPALKHLSHRSL